MRTKFLRVAVALAALLASRAGHAQQRAEASDPKIPFEKYTLDNGMEVILHQDKTAPVVYVSLWYHVGSGNETPGKSGFAHLFEHMMFQGSQHTGEDVHFPILRRIGVTNLNGTTNLVRTNYYEEIPSNQLETALWLESDRMGYMLPILTEKSLDNQREVVRNERRQSIDDAPYGKEYFATNEALYPEGHPYRYGVIGRHEDIAGASLDDVKGFFQKWYVPANATLLLSGDFDVPEAKRLIDKWFASFPKTTKPESVAVRTPMITKAVRVSVEDPFAALRRVHYAWHTPPLFQPGDAELDVLASALGNPGTGRLYKILVLEKQLARNVSVSQQSAAHSSTFNVVVDLQPDADQAVVEQIVNEELDKVRQQGVTDRELKRTVTTMEASNIWGLESLRGRGELLQTYNHWTGNPDYLSQDLDRYRNTTVDKVRDAAQRYLARNARVEIITVPTKKEGK